MFTKSLLFCSVFGFLATANGQKATMQRMESYNPDDRYVEYGVPIMGEPIVHEIPEGESGNSRSSSPSRSAQYYYLPEDQAQGQQKYVYKYPSKKQYSNVFKKMMQQEKLFQTQQEKLYQAQQEKLYQAQQEKMYQAQQDKYYPPQQEKYYEVQPQTYQEVDQKPCYDSATNLSTADPTKNPSIQIFVV